MSLIRKIVSADTVRVAKAADEVTETEAPSPEVSHEAGDVDSGDGAPPEALVAAAPDASSALDGPGGTQPGDESASATDPAGLSPPAAFLRAMAPLFRAALLYPGVDAPPEQWAAALQAMSGASARLANELARLHPDELDIAWSRREAHPECAALVSDWWISAVLSRGGARSVSELAEACEGIARVVVAAQRAVNLPVSGLAPSAEAALVRALALVCAESESYSVRFCGDKARPAVDSYLAALGEACIGAVAEAEERAIRGGVLFPDFRAHMVHSASHLLRAANEAALNEARDRIASLREEGKPEANGLDEPSFTLGMPLEAAVRRFRQSMHTLAGTTIWVARRLSAAGQAEHD